MANKKRIVRIRWDRIGFTVLALLLFVAELMSENYPALMWEGIATLLMVLLFREQDKCLNAMETAVKMAMVIKALTDDDGEEDGNTTTQS